MKKALIDKLKQKFVTTNDKKTLIKVLRKLNEERRKNSSEKKISLNNISHLNINNKDNNITENNGNKIMKKDTNKTITITNTQTQATAKSDISNDKIANKNGTKKRPDWKNKLIEEIMETRKMKMEIESRLRNKNTIVPKNNPITSNTESKKEEQIEKKENKDNKINSESANTLTTTKSTRKRKSNNKMSTTTKKLKNEYQNIILKNLPKFSKRKFNYIIYILI